MRLDPAEVRRKNLLPAFSEPHTTAFGAVYDSGDYATALDKALATAGYEDLRREQAKRRADGDVVQLGIGLSCYVEITGPGMEEGGPRENATVEVHPDGSATILTGTSPHGQGHVTVWAMLASEELGIPVDKIDVKWGDTDLIPEGGGTGGSRSLQQGGAAVRQASRDLLDVARQRAADELEANPADLVFDTESSMFAVAGDPDAAVPLARLAEQERLFVRAVFAAPGPTFPFGAHVAVAEVDTETGKAVLRRVVTVDDAGTVINPLLAEGQRHGGIAQGAAQALLEEVVYDADGNPLTASFADYPFVLGHRGAQLRAGRHGNADHLQPARRQGDRGGRHDRLHPGRAERARRRRGAPRRPAHRHARVPAAGLGGAADRVRAGRFGFGRLARPACRRHTALPLVGSASRPS